MNRFAHACVLGALAIFACVARADYPDKPIRIVVPFGAGGGIDSGARSLARGLSQAFGGRTVLVENKPGGNSVIGANAVVMSPADGYTFLFTSGSTVSVLPHLPQPLPFDPQKDLVPVGKVAKLPFIVLANKQATGAADLRQFIDKARAAPGQLTYASAGSGTGAHLGFELLKSYAKINVTHVPYKATSEALPDLLTGRVSAMMADPATARRALAEGSVTALATTTKDRASAFPDLPTAAEQGIDGFDLELWFGLFAPKGTPPAVIAQVNAAMTSYLQSAAGKASFEEQGYSVDPSSPAALQALARKESDQWSALAKTGVFTEAAK